MTSNPTERQEAMWPEPLWRDPWRIQAMRLSAATDRAVRDLYVAGLQQDQKRNCAIARAEELLAVLKERP